MMMWGGAPLRALEPLQAPIQVLHLRGDDFHHVYNEHDEIAVESPSNGGQEYSLDSLHSLLSRSDQWRPAARHELPQCGPLCLPRPLDTVVVDHLVTPLCQFLVSRLRCSDGTTPTRPTQHS